MSPLSDKQLELNQKFIDLIQEYFGDPEVEETYQEGYYVDAKSLFKYIWNQGYMLREKDNMIYE